LPQEPVNSQLGMPFIELQSVDSTNNYALAQIHAGLTQHGAAYFAHEQLRGKGQRGRTWVSERDQNIVLSVVINPYPKKTKEQFHLSAAVALAAHDLFSSYAGENTKIKWPNDLYWQDRKAGGILIESIIRQSWDWSVAGIGININQVSFPPEIHQAVSLKQVTGREFDPMNLAKELCNFLDLRFNQLVEEGFGPIHTAYLEQLYQKNRKVKLRQGARVFEAIIRSVNDSGQLIVEHAIEETFSFGEVEWLVS
jgi:BirA family biotin operon repressor/biotin-[acetyl-CoA-carboxylase] ligase